jgi:hypothetical protein
LRELNNSCFLLVKLNNTIHVQDKFATICTQLALPGFVETLNKLLKHGGADVQPDVWYHIMIFAFSICSYSIQCNTQNSNSKRYMVFLRFFPPFIVAQTRLLKYHVCVYSWNRCKWITLLPFQCLLALDLTQLPSFELRKLNSSFKVL